MKSELDAISDQGQQLIKRYGKLRDFLVQDEDIVLIDDYICLRENSETARRLALDQVLERSAAILNNNEKNHAEKPSSNVWNSKPIQTNSAGNSIDAILQLPEVESLFDYKCIQPPPPGGAAKTVSIPSSFPVPPPTILSKDPPPNLIKPNGYSSAVSCGNLVVDQNLEDFESLNKKLKSLTTSNSELLKQVYEKERIIQALSKLIPDPKDAQKVENLELELKKTKEELQKVKLERVNDVTIITLQKRLEVEIGKNRNLQHQLDMERSNNAKIVKEYNSILKMFPAAVPSTISAPSPVLFTNTSAAVSSHAVCNSSQLTGASSSNRLDSFGLRSIWDNAAASSSKPHDLRQSFSSSAGSILMNKPQNQPPPANIFAPFDCSIGGIFTVSPSTNTKSSSNSSFGSHKCL